MRNKAVLFAIAIPLCLLLVAFVYYLPPVHDRLAWRIDALQASIQYALNPPEEVVFVPQAQPTEGGIISATSTFTPGPTATATPPGPTPTPGPTLTPTLSPTPLPASTQSRNRRAIPTRSAAGRCRSRSRSGRGRARCRPR